MKLEHTYAAGCPCPDCDATNAAQVEADRFAYLDDAADLELDDRRPNRQADNRIYRQTDQSTNRQSDPVEAPGFGFLERLVPWLIVAVAVSAAGAAVAVAVAIGWAVLRIVGLLP
jgi:hypothetical protein